MKRRRDACRVCPKEPHAGVVGMVPCRLNLELAWVVANVFDDATAERAFVRPARVVPVPFRQLAARSRARSASTADAWSHPPRRAATRAERAPAVAARPE